MPELRYVYYAYAGFSFAIVWGAMAERAKLWVYFAFGVWFTLIYSVTSHWVWHAGRLGLVAVGASTFSESFACLVVKCGGIPSSTSPYPGGYGTESHSHLLGHVHRHPALEADAA